MEKRYAGLKKVHHHGCGGCDNYQVCIKIPSKVGLFQWTLMDELEVPADLTPGDYVLSFRSNLFSWLLLLLLLSLYCCCRVVVVIIAIVIDTIIEV